MLSPEVETSQTALDLDLVSSDLHQLGGVEPNADAWLACPRRGDLVLRHSTSGRIVQGQCRRLDCFACLVPLALDCAAALAIVRPDWMLTLTDVGPDWPQIRRRMQRFHEFLRRDGGQVHHGFHIEVNPAGTGNHSHGYLWGQPPSPVQLRGATRRAGLGLEHDLQRFQTPSSATVPRLKYGLKSVLDRPAGAVEMWPPALAFLNVNGARLVHSTNGFWRDGEDGRPLDGFRSAIRLARERAGLGGTFSPMMVTSAGRLDSNCPGSPPRAVAA
jgi:hypothetical protein